MRNAATRRIQSVGRGCSLRTRRLTAGQSSQRQGNAPAVYRILPSPPDPTHDAQVSEPPAGADTYKPMHILLVDDNPADVRMIRVGLREALPDASLHVAPDGVEALRFLRQEGEYMRSPRPDLILLDLRMPRMSGFDVLGEVKRDPSLLNIPVVVQSSSEAMADIQRAYGLHANCYVTKATTLDELDRVIGILAEFWTTVARLPDEGSPWKPN